MLDIWNCGILMFTIHITFDVIKVYMTFMLIETLSRIFLCILRDANGIINGRLHLDYLIDFLLMLFEVLFFVQVESQFLFFGSEISVLNNL